MNGPSSDIICSSDDDNKNLEWLLEAFGSKISIDDIASAYCEAGSNLHKTSEILCNMLGSSSSSDVPTPLDDPTSAPASSVGSATYVGKTYEPMITGRSVGTVSAVNGASDYARSGTSFDEPPKVLSRSKARNSGISVGTVSGIIGAGYGRSRTSMKEAYEPTKPLKLMSSEFPVSQIWDEQPLVNSTTDTMNKDVELFLLNMLGDGFQLDMEVIKEVVGGCGYDVRESMEKLINMSAPALDLGDVTSAMVDKTNSMDTSQDLDIKSEEKLQSRDSAGSDRESLEKEVLCKLFTVSERSEVGPRKILPRREPRTRKYGLVTGPLEDRATEFKTPIVKKEVNGDGNEEIEDDYEILREAAMEYWNTMKKYYRAAADAYAKGNCERATKLIKEGHFFMDKAREANEMSAKMLTQPRDDGEAISIYLNDYDPREAIRLLKTQLKSMCGIPSISYLKVMVGNDEKSKQNARKRVINKLLEREGISWTEEEDGKMIVIRIDVVNPKHLSFNKK